MSKVKPGGEQTLMGEFVETKRDSGRPDGTSEAEGRRKKNVSTPMCTPEGNGNANNCATIILLSDFDVPEYPFGAGMMVKLQSSICSTTFNKRLCLL